MGKMKRILIFICLLMVFACNLAGCASFSIDKETIYGIIYNVIIDFVGTGIFVPQVLLCKHCGNIIIPNFKPIIF